MAAVLPDDFIQRLEVGAAIVVLVLIGLALVVRWLMRKSRTPEIKLPWE
jgi:hypothetical protein